MSKQLQLDKLAQKIIDDNVGAELEAGATQLVMGNGSPDTDIVFIGEAPGKKEDEQGEPFVGAAGKFLDEMLGTINLTRKDVYVTNIVKYRPPDNRDPSPEEKQAFWPYLEQQLAILVPTLIVTLGRHSMEAFLPSFKISQIHGQPKRVRVQGTKYKVEGTEQTDMETRVIMPLYHPAAALYNGGMRQTLLDDFSKIPKVLELIKRDRSK